MEQRLYSIAGHWLVAPIYWLKDAFGQWSHINLWSTNRCQLLLSINGRSFKKHLVTNLRYWLPLVPLILTTIQHFNVYLEIIWFWVEDYFVYLFKKGDNLILTRDKVDNLLLITVTQVLIKGCPNKSDSYFLKQIN